VKVRRHTVRLTVISFFVCSIGTFAAVGSAHGASGEVLTPQDKAEIAELSVRYARSLSGCAPDEWADLFAASGGYFGSTSRGQVSGHDNLSALVRSEPGCTRPERRAGPGTAQRPANPPSVEFAATAQGASARIPLGNTAGYYEDTYVKTAKGWRFQSRNVVSNAKAAAHLTLADVVAIRHLAGDDAAGFDEVYLDAADAPHAAATPTRGAGRLFRASGLVITLAPDGAVKGRAFLRNDGGAYDDVYVRTANGWRFQSRLYSPAAK
jgi:hypothetical protein